MATPVYGKQFIRFAETALVPDASAIAQFTLVTINAAANTEPPTIALMAAAGEAFGVLQQEFNVATSGYATDLMRLGTVATSGLLLVAADGANLQAQGDALLVDATGSSSSAGAAVTVDASTPIVRQQVVIGGVNMVLVSFN
tara:strand:- start:1570 stop:1995 length:426 start_codon:yes stop_codon:yes gene_type:complete